MISQSRKKEARKGKTSSYKKKIYDSDDDSEFDELLQFQAFSTSTGSCSPSCNKKQRTDSGNDKDTDCKTSSDSQDDTSNNQVRAMKKAQASSVPDGITHPNMLFWFKPSRGKGKKSKGGANKCYFQWKPCRICSPEEVSGLDLPQEWDYDKKALVQYVEGTGFALRQVVSKNRLVPYHGREEGPVSEKMCDDEKNAKQAKNAVEKSEGLFQWCPLAMEETCNNNRKSRRKMFQDESNVLAVELYLKKVMDTAVERMKRLKADEKKKEVMDSGDRLVSSLSCEPQTHGNISDHEECSSSSPNSAIVSQEVCESDDDSTFVKASNRNKETLRAGDVIAYYQPNMIFGDERGFRTARIDEIACKKVMVLKLQGGDYLDREQRVKRLEKMFRGKLVSCDEPWVLLKNLRLRSGKLKGIQTTGIVEETKRIKRVLEKSNEETKEKLKSEGLGMYNTFLK